MDKNYWKNAYKNMWDASSEREMFIVQWIKENTGLVAKVIGLGAGTNDFINGSAAENGHEKGDADLHIVDTDVYIEVTGPLSTKVSPLSPLWFRPDKFNNAVIHKRAGHDTFFAHHCPSKNLWRVIHINDELVKRLYNRDFKVVEPVIRGRKERYVEIPYNDRCVESLEFLKEYLISKYC